MNHLEAAIKYASQGIPVFPLAPRSKQPLISARQGGHGLHDATTDPKVIKAWFQDHPTANIGLRTGAIFDVVDLDGEDAVDALELARDGRERIRGPVVATAKGSTTSFSQRAWATAPAYFLGSTFGEQAGTWRPRPRSIRQAFGTAGSFRTHFGRRRHGWLNRSGRDETEL